MRERINQILAEHTASRSRRSPRTPTATTSSRPRTPRSTASWTPSTTAATSRAEGGGLGLRKAARRSLFVRPRNPVRTVARRSAFCPRASAEYADPAHVTRMRGVLNSMSSGRLTGREGDPRILASLRRLNVEENRKRRCPALLLLQQEPEGRQEADRRADGLHLRRVRRHLPRHHRGRPGPRDAGPGDQAPEAEGDQGVPRRLRHRPGAGQEEAGRRGLQPLQADRLPREEPQARRRAPEVQHPPDRARPARARPCWPRRWPSCSRSRSRSWTRRP